MQLWTEYEGQTIDGAFLLEHLLLSEGRSAFFTASNGNGVPKLLRLIAAHFDEEEIQARWRGVEALNHPNRLKIERYGQVVLDDTTMVYAIFEPADASLADVLAGQRLTVPEAKQLALSVASVLEVLHKHGFVHEHVEPAKIFAVGEVVKLRCDCIRETPEGERGQEARKKDVRDLAAVVLQALTHAGTPEEAAKVGPLPAPLDKVVRNGWSGAWGVSEIMAALDADGSAVRAASSVLPAPPSSVSPASPPAPARVSVGPEKMREVAGASIEPASEVKRPEQEAAARGKFVPPGERRAAAEESPDRTTSVRASTARANVDRGSMGSGSLGRGNMDRWDLGQRSPLSAKWIALIAVAVILAFWLIWHGLHARPAAKSAAGGSSLGSSAAISQGSGQAGEASGGIGQGSAAKPTASHSAAEMNNPLPPPPKAGTGGREQWRVVAFTYNRQDQAQKKVDAIAQNHAKLRPEVFAPTGRAPYLVTVGGVMSRDQAFAFAQQARKQGLPRDTYAQNYSGKRP